MSWQSRVVTCSSEERSFHVFYQLLAGSNPEDKGGFFLSFFFFFLLFSFLFLHLLVMFSWQLLCTSNRLRITATCRMDASRSRGRMTRRILRIYMFARFPRLFPAGPISHLFPSLSLNWTFRWHWQSWGCRRKR